MPLTRFADVVQLNTGRVADPLAAGIERFVGLEHIEPENLHIRNWGLVADGTTFTNAFKRGQVLFGKRRAYQRKVAVAEFDGVCSSDIYVFESKDPNVLLPDLLPFICQSEGFYEYAVKTSAGSLSPRTNWSHLADYEFPLPPLDEQRRIADLLLAADNHLFETATLLEKSLQLRTSYIVDKFNQILNGNSKVVTVAQAGEVLMGRQRSPQYEKGISPRPYLRVANVYDGFVDTTDVKIMDFSDTEFETFGLKYGDVLLVEGHSSAEVVGRSLIFRDEVPGACFQNTLVRFRASFASPEFAHQYFRYCLYTKAFSRVAKQTTIAHLGSTRFSKMKFPIVSPEVDDEITKTVSEIEASIARTQQQIASTKNLKTQMFSSMLGNNIGKQ